MSATPTGPSRSQRLISILLPVLGVIVGIIIGMALSGLILGVSRPAPFPQPPVVGTPNAEVVALRAQLNTMREYDQRIIATVYWGLGIAAALVVGFTVILIGFNWFSNVRLIDRDKADLERELRADIRQQFADRQAEMMKAITAATEGAITKVRGEVLAQGRELRRALAELQCQNEIRDAKDWEAHGILENAITSYARAGEIALDNGFIWRIDDLVNEIQKLLVRTGAPSPSTVTDVNNMLSKFAPQYAPVVARIQALLQGT